MRFIDDLAVNILGTKEEFGKMLPDESGSYHLKLGNLYLLLWVSLLLTVALLVGGFIYLTALSNEQEGMWRAINFLVALMFVQIVISAVALLFLINRLNKQRRELGQANRAVDATINAAKPHVFATLECYFENNASGVLDRRQFSILPKIKNYGACPAYDLEYHVIIDSLGDLSFENIARSIETFEGMKSNGFVTGNGIVLASNDYVKGIAKFTPLDVGMHIGSTAQNDCLVWVAIRYRNALSTELEVPTTVSCFKIEFPVIHPDRAAVQDTTSMSDDDIFANLGGIRNRIVETTQHYIT